MNTLIIIGGFFGLAFFVFHIFFWKIFDWKRDLKSLTSINRNVMQVLNLCLMVCFLIFAYVSIFHTVELLTTGLGRSIMFGIAGLWLFRAVMQPMFFGLKNSISIAFFIVFLIGAGIYAVPLISGF